MTQAPTAPIHPSHRIPTTFGESYIPPKVVWRATIFVDFPNVELATYQLGIRVSYKHLLNHVTQGYELAGAFLYAGVHSAQQKRQLQSQASFTRYQVVERESSQYKDGSIHPDLTVEITTDLLIKAFNNEYDTAILVTGNSDFTYAVNRIRQAGKWVEIIGLKGSGNRRSMKFADKFTDLFSLRHWICEQ